MLFPATNMSDDADRWRLDAMLSKKGFPTWRWLRRMVWPKAITVTHAGAGGGSVEQKKKVRPTAYLDGIRGFAALLVYFHHHELWTHASMPNDENAFFENAFGWRDKYHLATFYGIRTFFTGGHMAVAVFYVLSGYVLSVKPLSLIHVNDSTRLGDNLASAMFRRWFRLYVPLIITTFVYITLWHVFGIWNSNCEPKETYGEEVRNWYVQFKNFSFIFKDGMPWLDYNTHLWSIPLEMRGSIVIFTTQLALSRATTRARLWLEVGLIFYFLYITDAYYCALFVTGMLQCDLDMLAKRDAEHDEQPANTASREFPAFLRALEPYKTFIYYHLLLLSIFFAGVPCQKADIELMRSNPGWYYLSYLKPQAVFDPKWFFLFWAATLFVACVPRLPWLKRFFESRFCQYLGRISFSLYLVHGPILSVIGDRLYVAVGWVRELDATRQKLAWWVGLIPLPKTGPLGLEPAFIMPNLVLLPLTIYVAHLVTTYVDEPTVKWVSWLYKRTLRGPEEGQSAEIGLMRRA